MFDVRSSMFGFRRLIFGFRCSICKFNARIFSEHRITNIEHREDYQRTEYSTLSFTGTNSMVLSPDFSMVAIVPVGTLM